MEMFKTFISLFRDCASSRKRRPKAAAISHQSDVETRLKTSKSNNADAGKGIQGLSRAIGAQLFRNALFNYPAAASAIARQSLSANGQLSQLFV